MDETLKAQSDQFSMLLTQKLIDAVKEKGFKTTVVAKEIGIGQASMSRYINGVREMPMSTFMAICSYADINPQRLFNAAYTQSGVEQVAIDPSMLSEDEKADLAMRDLGQSDFRIAALRDGNKKKESEHFADEGA
jgi:transcriptional regulator with XRE-family HTH domain